MSRPLLAAATAILLCVASAIPARADTFDACTGFVDSVPVAITSAGVWCLRQDLSTSISAGAAVSIEANNVTLDCNGFKIGGLAAGHASLAYGVAATDRSNLTVRHCHVRGFHTGIRIEGGSRHVVADNRVDQSLSFGIQVYPATASVVARNLLYRTGGGSSQSYVFGILANGRVVDNVVTGMRARRPDSGLYGIVIDGAPGVVQGNLVNGFELSAMEGGQVGLVRGITVFNSYHRLSDNHVVGPGGSGTGIQHPGWNFCLRNTAHGFATGITAGCTGRDNLPSP